MRIIGIFISLLILYLPQVKAAKPFETIQWQTKNGANVIFYQTMEVPMLDIIVAFAAGSAYDGDQYGLSWLTTNMLNQGNQGFDAQTIAEQLSATGAQYEGAISKDMAVLSLKTLSSKNQLQAATKLFSTIIAHPDFNKTAFLRQKNQQLVAIDQQQESPDEVANQTFFQILYKNHPYRHPSIGVRQNVSQLTLENLHQFYQQYFVAKNASIVFVGAIDKTTAQNIAEQITKDLPSGKTAPGIPKAPALTEQMDIEVKFPSTQTVLRLGQLGITHKDKRFFPLQVGNYILGGGTMTSELAIELRENRGLTYNVSSQLLPMPGMGAFIIGLSTKNNQASNATEMTRKILSSFVQNGPTEQELKAAKEYLSGNFSLSLASNRNIADILLRINFYHLPADFLQNYINNINAVTIDEIKKAFNELIVPDKLLQVSVGKV